MDEEKIKQSVGMLIEALGLDINEENFTRTPERVTRVYKELLEGLEVDSTTALETSFPSKYTGIVSLEPVKVLSLCPHHLLPVSYSIRFAYLPDGKVLGFSKITKFIKLMAKRPILQEDLTDEIVKKFTDALKPQGAICVVTGDHFCMRVDEKRGQRSDSKVTTSSLTGIFLKEPNTKEEALKLFNFGDSH